MSNSLKFRRVGPARWWDNALLPLVRIERFLLASWPVQRRSDFKVSPLPPPLVAVDLAYSQYSTLVLAVPVFSHNLVPRVGTIGMQCEYYTTGTIFAPLVLCCSLKTYSRIIAI